MQDNEKAKLEEQRIKVIDRTKAIIEQAEKTRNSAVPGPHLSSSFLSLILAVLSGQ